MPLKDKTPFSKPPVYLIDGSSYLYRGYYAYGDLSRSDGFPTNALFIVMRLLMRLLREEQPEYALFVLDGKGPNFRHEIYKEYKANREAMPEPLAMQIAPLKEGVELLGVPVHTAEGAEADDVIASLAAARRAERPVVIIGSDKDLKQCLDENVLMWDPAAKKEKIVTLADFAGETSFPPSSWPDFQALVGDSSDNIPGVPGVGKVTAGDMLGRFPTLEELERHIDELKPAQQKKLRPHLEDMYLYRELTRLKTDIDVPALDDMAVRRADPAQVRDFLMEYEFRSLARDAEQMFSQGPGAAGRSPAKASSAAANQGQLSLFDAGGGGGEDKDAGSEIPVVDASTLPDVAGKCTALVPRPEGMYLGTDGSEYLYSGEAAPLAEALAKARRIAVPSLKELLRGDDAWARVPLKVWFDLGLAAYLLNPEQRNYSWDRLRDSLFSDPAFDAGSLPPGSRAPAALALAEVYAPRLEGAGLKDLIERLESPLIPVLVRMERAGIGIDRTAFSAFLKEVEKDLDELTGRVFELAGKSFNIRSSRQLAEVLFTDLGLARQGKTPGGAASTSSTVLEKLKGRHPVVEAVLDHRRLEKLRSTYLSPLPKMVDASGRLHTTFNQLATATGRLSSSNPNLQNIPIRGPLGRRMRACFTAAPGNALIASDYSQIELRVLAHLSKEPTLLRAFEEDGDIHAQTAALLFDKAPEAVSEDERRNAKTINFGLLYGMGPQKLSRELGLKLDRAKEFISRYFERLQGLKRFYDAIVSEAEENGYVTTLAGRRRLLPEIRSRNAQLLSQAKRQAINTVVQGGAADIIKMAMLAVDADKELKALGAGLILQVHDELVMEAPKEAARPVGARLAELMAGVVALDVPLKADLGVGPNWSEAH